MSERSPMEIIAGHFDDTQAARDLAFMITAELEDAGLLAVGAEPPAAWTIVKAGGRSFKIGHFDGFSLITGAVMSHPELDNQDRAQWVCDALNKAEEEG